jgi:hypothetical protein
MPKSRILALGLLASMYLHPIQAAEGSLKGKFAFNWLSDPSKTRCVRVDDKLMSMFASPQFKCRGQNNTASGVPATACSKVDGGSEYLIFDTFASCENERKTQAANE